MCAFEVVKDKTTKEPDKALTKRIVKEANKRGLLLLDAGIFGNVIRILMPIVITDDQLQEGLDILKQSIAAAASVEEEVTLL